jgi:endonuclease/exonuclease/phosphatase family metal-dependent hydrolase
VRQIEQVVGFLKREVPRRDAVVVAGDFNDWGGKLRATMNAAGLKDFVGERQLTYPSRLPLTQLDYVYARGSSPWACTFPAAASGGACRITSR